MDIMHRFGTWNKGYQDFWGFFAPSNIRIGISYVPINKLNVELDLQKPLQPLFLRQPFHLFQVRYGMEV